MLPIRAEGHAAGQQLNVGLPALHVLSSGLNCYSSEASLEGASTYIFYPQTACLCATASLSPLFQQGEPQWSFMAQSQSRPSVKVCG